MTQLRRTIRTVTTLAAAMLAVMALGVGVASAQAYPPDEPGSVDCVAAGQAGLSVTCTVTGATPGEVLDWTATARGDTFASGTVTADADGRATFRFTTPNQYRGETIDVAVLGNMGFTAEDEVVVAEAPGRAGQAVPPGRTAAAGLARTGQDTVMLAGLGAALLGAGVVALRRRTKQTTSDRTTTSV
jgi:LPXTG-motif cell wall-anchored protein